MSKWTVTCKTDKLVKTIRVPYLFEQNEKETILIMKILTWMVTALINEPY